MSTRLSHYSAKRLTTGSTSSSLPAFLIPSLNAQSQRRCASILSSLSDNKAAYAHTIRRGRGPSSGKGKTSGRGHGGQKQHGKVPRGFEGGQTPLVVVHGVRGFENKRPANLVTLPLTRIQSWIQQKRLNPSFPITVRELAQSRCCNETTRGIKLLATSTPFRKMSSVATVDSDNPPLSVPINIIVSRASKAAIAAVEALGGTVTTRFYTPNSIKRILKGRTDPVESLGSNKVISGGDVAAANGEDGVISQSIMESESVAAPRKPGFHYRLPDPTSRKDIEYYRDPAHRGYLNYQVPEGHGPSLFFKTPGTGRKAGVRRRGVGKGKRNVGGENKIW
ncbi:YmL10 [Agyrium rufum]|nr:YmL10 [Agyrium rufum]